MYECTCVICGKRFTLDQAYDVCSLDCEGERLKRPGDQSRYAPGRDDKIVQPQKVKAA